MLKRFGSETPNTWQMLQRFLPGVGDSLLKDIGASVLRFARQGGGGTCVTEGGGIGGDEGGSAGGDVVSARGSRMTLVGWGLDGALPVTSDVCEAAVRDVGDAFEDRRLTVPCALPELCPVRCELPCPILVELIFLCRFSVLPSASEVLP